jgi:cyclopropane fatty-acyl-phospholipid synthase-like methyltransferase
MEFLARAAGEGCFRTYLDFGAGIGSLGIYFAHMGLEVTLADISPHLLDYAAWRFRRRGLKLNTIDLGKGGLPEDRFDLVTSLDVFEHLPDPQAVLRSVAASMKQGGLFAFNVAPKDANYPQHVSCYEDVAWGVRAAGFRQKHVLRGVHVLQRVGNPSVMRPCYAALGYVWFRLARPPIVRTFEALGIKERLKRLIRGNPS